MFNKIKNFIILSAALVGVLLLGKAVSAEVYIKEENGGLVVYNTLWESRIYLNEHENKNYSVKIRNIPYIDDSFKQCKNLVEVLISNDVFEIGKFAFTKCDNLKKVIICDGLTSICQYAFCGCTTLEYVKLPDTLIEIDYYAFAFCWRLDPSVVPHSITTIGIYCGYELIDITYLENFITDRIKNHHIRASIFPTRPTYVKTPLLSYNC